MAPIYIELARWLSEALQTLVLIKDDKKFTAASDAGKN